MIVPAVYIYTIKIAKLVYWGCSYWVAWMPKWTKDISWLISIALSATVSHWPNSATSMLRGLCFAPSVIRSMCPSGRTRTMKTKMTSTINNVWNNQSDFPIIQICAETTPKPINPREVPVSTTRTPSLTPIWWIIRPCIGPVPPVLVPVQLHCQNSTTD